MYGRILAHAYPSSSPFTPPIWLVCVNAVQVDQFADKTHPLLRCSIEELKRVFFSRLPEKPYCADFLGYTVIRGRSKAALKKYIQVNHPSYKHFIVIDIDVQGAALPYLYFSLYL